MESKNQHLWRIAQMRARFKNSAISYLIVNTALIAIWFFSSGPRHFFWPVFPLFFWGMGLAFQYYYAYFDKGQSIQKEYEKLLREQ
jgi:hypothetical protein